VNAGDLVTRSLTLARERNVVVMVPLVLWTLGQVHVLSGRVSEGVVLGEIPARSLPRAMIVADLQRRPRARWELHMVGRGIVLASLVC
jgi:hypothetical protein